MWKNCIDSDLQRFSRLDVPTKNHYLFGTTTLTHTGRLFWYQLLMLIIDIVHSHVHWHCLRRFMNKFDQNPSVSKSDRFMVVIL